jgi:NAD(P)-dependent dehydrogenase (short-subunit alcohol dehydrogenase family)
MSVGDADRVAWVTGASGAIGAAVVKALVPQTTRVFVSSRNGAALEQLCAEVARESGAGRAIALPLDVADRRQVEGAVATIAQAGRLDILVNSTTRPIFGDALELDDSDWEAVLQAKFMGYLRTMRAALPLMIRQGAGCIVNISGRGGHQPSSPAHLPGSAANAAVNVLTKGMANIYGRHGIRINAVAPGPIASERYDRIAAANARLAEKSGGPARPGPAAGTALGEIGQPADVADAVSFLASERARHITGIVLQVDGGGTATL